MAIIAVLVKFETNLKMYIKVTRYLLQVHVQFIEISASPGSKFYQYSYSSRISLQC